MRHGRAPTGLVDHWIERLGRVLLAGKGYTSKRDEAELPAHRRRVCRHPRHACAEGQGGRRRRDLRQILARWATTTWRSSWPSQDCEVNCARPDGLCAVLHLQHGRGPCASTAASLAVKAAPTAAELVLDSIERAMLEATARRPRFHAPAPFLGTGAKAARHHFGWVHKMGEGWLLTAEMMELVQSGYGNIVCAQPFGCLPNHIVRQGHDQQDPSAVSRMPTSPPSTTTPAPPRSTRKTASS